LKLLRIKFLATAPPWLPVAPVTKIVLVSCIQSFVLKVTD
jgi:hypothetical protein